MTEPLPSWPACLAAALLTWALAVGAWYGARWAGVPHLRDWPLAAVAGVGGLVAGLELLLRWWAGTALDKEK